MTQAMCTSFKVEMLKAQHDFSASGGHTFKLALYTPAATLGPSTTAYSDVDEVWSTGYSVGGFSLTNVEPTSSGTAALCTFATNPSWSGVSFTASQALLYNSSVGSKAVAVYDFGGSQTVSSGVFEVTLPPATATTAMLRFT